jgi:hypothetical protein
MPLSRLAMTKFGPFVLQSLEVANDHAAGVAKDVWKKIGFLFMKNLITVRIGVAVCAFATFLKNNLFEMLFKDASFR